ncbi:MAG: hypothetical protein ACJ8GN_18160 [Longimicrobiaceae bacterium]
MDFVKVWNEGGTSGAEMLVLLALVAVVAVVAWKLFRRYSGHATSDVKGLHFSEHPHDPPE